MQQTTNYQLPQWEAGDQIRREDFNGAFGAVDTALKANADAVATLSQSVGIKGKTCRIAYGSYKGSGKFGKSNPNQLTFDFKPHLVVINCLYGANRPTNGHAWVYGAIRGSTSSYACILTWSGNTLSWYTETGDQPEYQLNGSNSTYCYVALGYEE